MPVSPSTSSNNFCDGSTALRAAPTRIRGAGAGGGEPRHWLYQLYKELVELGLHAVTRYQPQSDKIMRMHAQTAMIENGFVHLPREAGWRAEYLHELTVFPGGKYDDQVDSTAQFLDWLKGVGREPRGIYRYYKELVLAPHTARPEPLSVMARPLGLLRRERDRVAEMSEWDTAPLPQAGGVKINASDPPGTGSSGLRIAGEPVITVRPS